MKASGDNRPSLRQRRYVAEDGRISLPVPLLPNHPALQLLTVEPGEWILAKNGSDDDIRIQLGVDFVDELILVDPSDSQEYWLSVPGHNRIVLTWADGSREVLTYDFAAKSLRMTRTFKDVVAAEFGGNRVVLTADGGIVGDNLRWDAVEDWERRIGNEMVTCHRGVVSSSHSEAVLYYAAPLRRWLMSVDEEAPWSFGEVLNGESAVSAEIFGGLVTVYANGSVTLFNTHSFTAGSSIDQVLLGDEGECLLYVCRGAGERDIYLHEHNAPTPTGVLRYVPEYFVGKDGETYYPAWLYAASAPVLPPSRPGTSFFGTLFAALLLVLCFLALAVVPAAVVVGVIVCVLALRPVAASFLHDVRCELGV